MTRAFEDRERELKLEVGKLREKLKTNAGQLDSLSTQLKQKETDLLEQKAQFEQQVAGINAFWRKERDKLLISHKNETRVMSSTLHALSSRIAFD